MTYPFLEYAIRDEQSVASYTDKSVIEFGQFRKIYRKVMKRTYHWARYFFAYLFDEAARH